VVIFSAMLSRNGLFHVVRLKARLGILNITTIDSGGVAVGCGHSLYTTSGSDLDASKLTIHKTLCPQKKPPYEQLVFGRTFSDHMLEVNWTLRDGWYAPIISPYHCLSLEPSASVLQYSLECFEGMKAYKDRQHRIRLFRPMMNMNRLNMSAARLNLPTCNGMQLLECIKMLLKLDHEWIPQQYGYSLYLRPTLIGTQCALGVVGSYFQTGLFKPIKLYTDTNFVRAWPGGTGDVKVGSNYGLTVLAQRRAQERGCQQMLWLFGPDLEVTEAGNMNLFMFWINEQGRKELITAPLDGTILPGVTRDSVLTLCRQWKEFDVSERKWTLGQLLIALKEARVLEIFGTGTAGIITPIRGLVYLNQELEVPLNLSTSSSKLGALSSRLLETIMAIQYGDLPHEWSVLVD
jgi:branched-chain amino acid aminotransferase